MPRGASLRLGFLAAIGPSRASDAASTAPQGASGSGAQEAHAPRRQRPHAQSLTSAPRRTGRAAVEADPTAVFTDYRGDETSKFLAAINAVPPVTEYLAEHVLVVETPDDEPVMVALVHDGSVVWSNAARHEDWTKVRRGAIGDLS